MTDHFNFPPGSLGAQQAGCTCDSKDVLDANCDLHGVSIFLEGEIQRVQQEAWEMQVARTKHRLRWLAPLMCLATIAIVGTLGVIGETMARAFVTGALIATWTTWYAWNRP